MTKKQSSGYYIGRMVLISLISLRRLLRQRGFVSFRLLFLATAQRVSRCSLPSLGEGDRGRGTSMSFITYVIMTSVHYVIMASASFCLSFWLLSIMSLRLLFPCYFVFYILCPLCLPFILSGLEGLLCKLFLRTYYFVEK